MPKITRRGSLVAGAALMMMPRTSQAEPAGVASDPVLHWLGVSSLAIRRLSDLDLAGRSQMTFMRGHMAEVMKTMKAQDYFESFYSSVGKEFLQFDDYSFVLHHNLRILYGHWKEENDLLRAGALGVALAGVGGRLPEMRDRPAAPNRRPDVVKANWYGEVYSSLSKGSVPTKRGVRNEVLRPDQCVLSGERGLDLIWASFLVYACEVWSRQIPLMWELVGSAIALRRSVEQMSKGEVESLARAAADKYRKSSISYAEAFASWQDYHAGTVGIHDPMFDRVVNGLTSWLKSLTKDLGTWTIKPALKDEMYAEIASSILLMRGTPTTVSLPKFDYWRVLQFSPPSNKIGAPGMPPFDTAYFTSGKDDAAVL